MKKLTALLLAALMLAAALSACGKKSENLDLSQFRTLADTFAYPSCGEGFSEEIYVYVFEKDGVYYRVRADLPQDISDAIWAIDFFDEERDAKIHEIIGGLSIAKAENLNDQKLSDKEMNALVGKTGQDLMNDGWYNSGYNLDDMEFWMNKGPFTYSVVFDGKLTDSDDFNAEEAIVGLTIKSVTFDGIGDATNID